MLGFIYSLHGTEPYLHVDLEVLHRVLHPEAHNNRYKTQRCLRDLLDRLDVI